MKAAVVTGPGRLEIRDIKTPKPGPYDCLVKIDACAVCTGTDSSIVYKSFPWRSPYPFVLGHESTGIIQEIGKRVKNFKAGQRVTRPAAILAGETVNGISSTWGGYAEYGLVRDVTSAKRDGVQVDGMLASSRNPLPDDVDPVYASLSINQREILSVTSKIPFKRASAVLVIGSGYNGLLFSLFSKYSGAGRVIMVGNPRQAQLAVGRYTADGYVDYHEVKAATLCRKELGGDPTYIIDAVGTMASLKLAQELLEPHIAFGLYGLDEYSATIDIREHLTRTHPVLDMSTDEANYVDEWYRLWKEGFFMQPGIYDQVMPLAQIHQAFEILTRREAVKIVLEI